MPSFGRGIRMRHERDGTALLVVPEGIVRLNGAAAAALALVDGSRTLDEIITLLGRQRFDADLARIDGDVRELFARLRARRLIR